MAVEAWELEQLHQQPQKIKSRHRQNKNNLHVIEGGLSQKHQEGPLDARETQILKKIDKAIAAGKTPENVSQILQSWYVKNNSDISEIKGRDYLTPVLRDQLSQRGVILPAQEDLDKLVAKKEMEKVIPKNPVSKTEPDLFHSTDKQIDKAVDNAFDRVRIKEPATAQIMADIDETIAITNARENIEKAVAQEKRQKDIKNAVATAQFFANKQEIPLSQREMDNMDKEYNDIQALKENKKHYEALVDLLNYGNQETFEGYLSKLNFNEQKAVLGVLQKYNQPEKKSKESKTKISWIEGWLKTFEGKQYTSLLQSAPKEIPKTGWFNKTWTKIKNIFE